MDSHITHQRFNQLQKKPSIKTSEDLGDQLLVSTGKEKVINVEHDPATDIGR